MTGGVTRFVPFALVALLIVGCASDEGGVVTAGRPERAEERIRTLIEEESRPERALTMLPRLQEQGLIEPTRGEELRSAAVRETERLFRAALEENRVVDALVRRQNLELLGRLPEEPSPSRGELMRELADSYLERNNNVGALAVLLRHPDLAELSPAELVRYGRVAQESNNRFALRRIMDALASAGEDPPEEFEAALEKSADTSEMINGTVTVWVNRGMRINQGVGVPDRVIGSGFFIDRRGYLMTNYHVIASEVDPEYEGYSRLFVKLPGSSNERTPARVVGYDRVFDLALLKVEIDPDYVFAFTNIRKLESGADIRAIGSPGGLENSISSGIISAQGRRFLQMGDALQIDVPVNPGNSGGPLITKEGDLIGVVFAGIEQFEGVNFAIPSFWIRHFLEKFYDGGEVKHAWIGVAVREDREGLEVIYVAPDSPAEEAGLRRGDVITAVNDQELGSIADANDFFLSMYEGNLVKVSYSRPVEEQTEEEQESLVYVDERPFSPAEEALEAEDVEELFPAVFGMAVREIRSLPWQEEFVVTEVYPGSVADESGLSVNDPFSLRNWRVNRDARALLIQIIVKKRKAGFLETGLQLGAYLETDNFI
ncbi:MAG: trypsin-like peptidase domain-containing protein [Spirochaetaceae bacterium]